MNQSADIAIVGGGIVGLAHAYMALRKGYRVVLFEREQLAMGASVRNFGLLWPIGQEPGIGLDRAMRSRQHWIEISEQAGIWLNNNGSFHLAYHDDEWSVLNEFIELHHGQGYACELMDASDVLKKSVYTKGEGLKGGLWSKTECTVNPRQALRMLPEWLEKKYNLILRYGHVVTEIALPVVKTSRESWHVQKVFVCSGADFETLYPAVYDQFPVGKCKLQMMKAKTQSPVTLGPTLCAGLTLRHYAAFSRCKTLSKLNERYDLECPYYKEHGIHVLLAQHGGGELIIGDSHHYNETPEPFDGEEINQHILNYLQGFTTIDNFRITERWHGIYPTIKGDLNLIVEPEPDVTIVNCLGGAGMTLSFGLAEEVIGKL